MSNKRDDLLASAAECERKALLTSQEDARATYADLARQWRTLAADLEIIERLRQKLAADLEILEQLRDGLRGAHSKEKSAPD